MLRALSQPQKQKYCIVQLTETDSAESRQGLGEGELGSYGLLGTIVSQDKKSLENWLHNNVNVLVHDNG